MSTSLRLTWVVLLWGLAGGSAQAISIAGVCPDGSAFIVHRLADVPCPRAKLVAPSDLPPLRPELLPHPYTWHVDQEARDPHNPYNLIDAAQKIRALRAGEVSAEKAKLSRPQVAAAGAQARPDTAPSMKLSESELRDLMRLIELRQQVAPAALSVQDVQGREQLAIQIARSPSLEARILERLGGDPAQRRVLVFSAYSPVGSEFHPNFLVVQGSLTFRPEPSQPEEVGFLLGEPGPLPRGTPTLGYLVIPARFDPTQPMDLWWNDRSFSAVLSPVSAG